MKRCKWKLNDEDYEFIKGEVIHIFLKYNIRCVPVSGFEIASKMGITLIPYSSLSAEKMQIVKTEVSKDGFYVEYKGRTYIFYNDIGVSYERQNWTILHEIGHVVLDHRGHSRREEDEANFFAKFAIAPPVLIHELKLSSVSEICTAFNISHEAATYSLEYYRKWLRNHKKTEEYMPYENQLIQYFYKDMQTQMS